jgi:hypothetical protein
MRFQVSCKTSQTFRKDGDIDPPHKFMSVVDIENQDPRRIGAAFLLSSIGHAQVEIPLRPGLPEGEAGDCQKNRGKHP